MSNSNEDFGGERSLENESISRMDGSSIQNVRSGYFPVGAAGSDTDSDTDSDSEVSLYSSTNITDSNLSLYSSSSDATTIGDIAYIDRTGSRCDCGEYRSATSCSSCESRGPEGASIDTDDSETSIDTDNSEIVPVPSSSTDLQNASSNTQSRRLNLAQWIILGGLTHRQRDRKRKRSGASPNDRKRVCRRGVTSEKQFTIASCRTSCPCKTRGRDESRIPDIKRYFDVPKPYYKTVLKDECFEMAELYRLQCCDKNCSFRWTRELWRERAREETGSEDECWPDSVRFSKLRRKIKNIQKCRKSKKTKKAKDKKKKKKKKKDKKKEKKEKKGSKGKRNRKVNCLKM